MCVHHDLFYFLWQGNAAFRRKDFESAVEYFTQVTGSLFVCLFVYVVVSFFGGLWCVRQPVCLYMCPPLEA
jgi:hypothetical protein